MEKNKKLNIIIVSILLVLFVFALLYPAIFSFIHPKGSNNAYKKYKNICKSYGNNYSLVIDDEASDDDFGYYDVICACCEKKYDNYGNLIERDTYESDYCKIEKIEKYTSEKYTMKKYTISINIFEKLAYITLIVSVILTWVYSIKWWKNKNKRSYGCINVLIMLCVSLLSIALSTDFENELPSDGFFNIEWPGWFMSVIFLIIYIIATLIPIIVNLIKTIIIFIRRKKVKNK